MPLTDVKIRGAKPKAKSYKLYDSGGLYLHVLHSGGRVWRYKYNYNEKEKLLTIGKYPAIGLKLARELQQKAYILLASGIDPAQAKQDEKARLKRQQEAEQDHPTGKTFKEVALAWADFKARPNTKRNWKFSHKKTVLNSLEREVFPLIGDRIIHTLTSDDVDNVIEPIQSRGH